MIGRILPYCPQCWDFPTEPIGVDQRYTCCNGHCFMSASKPGIKRIEIMTAVELREVVIDNGKYQMNSEGWVLVPEH